MPTVKAWSAVVCLLLFATAAVAQRREEYTVLSPKAQEPILKVLTASPQFLKVTEGTKKMVVCSVVQYTGKRGELKGKPLAQAMHYRYDDGVTVRTTLNLADKKVVRVERLVAYPTPLAPVERREALALAQEKSPEVKALLEKYKEEERSVEVLVPVVSQRDNRLFGKRLVSLRVVPNARPEDSAAVMVNLTDRTVWKQ
jgi:hypothetical protein